MTITAAELAVFAAPSFAAQPHWIEEHRGTLRGLVAARGAVLVRGLDVRTPATASAVSHGLADQLMPELEGFAPRTSYGGGVYSGTIWPPDQPMCMHHELSYRTEIPSLLIFSCLTAPALGGATALADGAAVLSDLPPDLVGRFEAAGWELRRTHNDVVGVPWATAFGTSDRAQVERYCEDHGIRYRWQADGGLHTRRTMPALLTHPAGGPRVWFNQIAFLNEWTMEPAVRDYLTSEFGPDGLPFTTFCGDGQPIGAATVDGINEVYAAHTMREEWQSGDLLLVDNLRMAHSREAYTGAREIVVALADPVSRS
jgi:alpha-ketoglutarate-dependent taurine dioxygenase